MIKSEWESPLRGRRGTTVTVTVKNPIEATSEELLEALKEQHKDTNFSGTEWVEYINSRKEDGRVCFGVSWVVPGEV